MKKNENSLFFQFNKLPKKLSKLFKLIIQMKLNKESRTKFQIFLKNHKIR